MRICHRAWMLRKARRSIQKRRAAETFQSRLTTRVSWFNTFTPHSGRLAPHERRGCGQRARGVEVDIRRGSDLSTQSTRRWKRDGRHRLPHKTRRQCATDGVGLRAAIRSKKLCRDRAATCLLDALAAQEPTSEILIEASLCVNDLSKAAADVSTDNWEAIAQQFVPNFVLMSTRNLTLLVNALSHARVKKELWVPAAMAALKTTPKQGYSSQDLCVLLSAMVRLSCDEEVFITRLLSEECLPRVPDLAPRGIAAFAHAVTKLGQEARAMDHAEALVRALLPKLVTFVKDGALLPLEIALAIDALSRYGDGAEPLVPGKPQLPKWADKATSHLEVALLPSVASLKPLEVVMVISALSRRGYVGADLAAELSSAIAVQFAKWPPEELCVVVHSAARLDLPGLVDGSTAPIWSILQHVEKGPMQGQLLKDCSSDHLVLLLHGLAKLLVQPSVWLWECVLGRVSGTTDTLSRPSAIRLFLAAAKADFRHTAIRCVVKRKLVAEDFAVLSEDAFAAVIYGLLHPFYYRRKMLQELLAHAARSRQVDTQSLALQTRLGLLHFFFSTKGMFIPSLAQIYMLSQLEAKTSEKLEWSRELRSRPSALQSDVHFHVNAIAASSGARVCSEVLLWPFCIDLLWQRVLKNRESAGACPREPMAAAARTEASQLLGPKLDFEEPGKADCVVRKGQCEPGEVQEHRKKGKVTCCPPPLRDQDYTCELRAKAACTPPAVILFQRNEKEVKCCTKGDLRELRQALAEAGGLLCSIELDEFTIKEVQNGWATTKKRLGGPKAAGEKVFRKLKKQVPRTEAMLKRSSTVWHLFTDLLQALDQPKLLQKRLEYIALRHMNADITTADIEAFGNILLEVCASRLGGLMTPEFQFGMGQEVNADDVEAGDQPAVSSLARSTSWGGRDMLYAMESLVPFIGNIDRVQEDCDVLTLTLAKHGNVNLKEFRSVMFASLRSLLPTTWSSEHESAWAWFWSIVESQVEKNGRLIGNHRQCLRTFLGRLDEATLAGFKLPVFDTFFANCEESQLYLRAANKRLV
ncbi:unnamed protein product [Symbiodinium sp. KB8]|nr:unnamed protein product [Symbiodinium sp. KB8]